MVVRTPLCDAVVRLTACSSFWYCAIRAGSTETSAGARAGAATNSRALFLVHDESASASKAASGDRPRSTSEYGDNSIVEPRKMLSYGLVRWIRQRLHVADAQMPEATRQEMHELKHD